MLVTTRVLVRRLSRTLHIALALAAPVLLVALLYAPFSGWGPFAGPSPLGGCPSAPSAAAVLDKATPREMAVSLAAWAAPLLVLLGVVGFVAGWIILDAEPCLNREAVRGMWRTCLLAVTAGWMVALCLGMTPC